MWIGRGVIPSGTNAGVVLDPDARLISWTILPVRETFLLDTRPWSAQVHRWTKAKGGGAVGR